MVFGPGRATPNVKRATVDPDGAASEGGVDRIDLGSELGAGELAAVRYRLAPGEGFPSGLHAHDDQEEVFVILGGTTVFEYLPPTDAWAGESPIGREITVESGEAVRFAPGDFQTGRNPKNAEEDVVALALGAPRDTSDVRLPATCPECDAPTLRLGTDGDTFTFDCPDCEASFEPAPCHDCGSFDLGMRLDADGHPVSRCTDCESEFSEPPLAD
jgi:uncharacterized cupin superfamily protein